MRRILLSLPVAAFALYAAVASVPAAAQGVSCSQIPQAQHFIDGLRPGPNTAQAQRHLDLAKAASSDRQCVSELRRTDYYAKRSAAADRHATRGRVYRHVLCADALHQDRPGGTDYHGPYVARCGRR